MGPGGEVDLVRDLPRFHRRLAGLAKGVPPRGYGHPAGFVVDSSQGPGLAGERVKTFGLMSIIFVTVAAPLLASRDPSPSRGVRRMVVVLLGFNALYVAYLTLVHVALYEPNRW